MTTTELKNELYKTNGDIRKIKRFLSDTIIKHRDVKAYDLYLSAIALLVNEVLSYRTELTRLKTTTIWRVQKWLSRIL